MTRVEQLEQLIVRLNPDEFVQLRDWLLEHSPGANRSFELDAVPVLDPLSALREEFDRELAVLQAPGASERLRKAFASTPAEIADAANDARQRNS
jgi:hypothetical protein